jgi:hypothetical protein
MIWTVMKLKLKNGYYRLRTISKVVWKIIIAKYFINKNCIELATVNEALISVILALLIAMDCNLNARKVILYITATIPSLLTDALKHSSPTFH